MLVINIVTWVSLTLMATGLVSVLCNLVARSRADAIKYLRGFKRGKGVLIYFFAIPLYFVGINYSGKSLIDSFFLSIRRIVDLVVLKYEVDPVAELMADSALYSFTLYFCFVLVGLNAIMFAMSLANQHLWGFRKNLLFRFSGDDRLMIFGNNEQSRLVYKSEKSRAKIIVDNVSDTDAFSLYVENVGFMQTLSFVQTVKKAVVSSLRRRGETVIVVNTLDDEKNIEIGRMFIEEIRSLSDEERSSCFGTIRIFVFGDPRYEAIYEDLVSDGLGCISYVNKYQKIAMDFVDRYPFTRFMSAKHIDYKTSLVREGVDINAVMIGFGKTNRQIFLTSVANNQFVTATKRDACVLKKVTYHIFDKENAENNKNLNHTYNRFKNELRDINPKDYLALPEHPAEEKYYTLDVNDTEFYSSVRRAVSSSENGVSFIIIAYGSDLENIDMAQKLLAKAKEWGCKNLYVFVKIRRSYKGSSLLDERNCFIFANESESVYDIGKICADEIFKMARLRDSIYAVESKIKELGDDALTEQTVEQIRAEANRDWYLKKTQTERDSSLYCCLSLKSKLHMMGLDYVKREGEKGMSNDEYLAVYAGRDLPDRAYYGLRADGKDIIHYTTVFLDSRRRNMAIHEHLRWNSYMISKGMIPATKGQILDEMAEIDGVVKHTNGKSYEFRRHGNLTTFAGLCEYRRMLAIRDGVEEVTKDVIKYDYQLLDDAYWLLDKTGYMIVRRSICN